MSVFREQLEALRSRNGNDSCSQVEEINPPTGAYLTNLLLFGAAVEKGRAAVTPKRTTTEADGS